MRIRSLWVLLVAVFVTLVLSSFSIYRRYQVETENRSVALASELDTLEQFAAGQAVPVPEALKRLRVAGLRAVVLGEETISELIAGGRAFVEPVDPSGRTVLRVPNPSDRERIVHGLQIRFGKLAVDVSHPDGRLVLPAVSIQLVRAVSIGLDPAQCELAKNADLQIIGRYSNVPGISSAAVRETLQWGKELGAGIYLPQGEQVLGRRFAVKALLDSLVELNILYASPEFAKIGGDAEVVDKAQSSVVRLHSAQAAELDKLSPIDAIERYGKAARERNMRILLLRPLSFSAEDPLSAFGGFVQDVAKQVMHEGGVLGSPHPYREPNLPRLFIPLIGIAAMAVVWWIGAQYVNAPGLLVAGGALAGLLGLSSVQSTGLQITTLVAATAFPLAAFLSLDRYLETTKQRGWVPILAGFLLVSTISLAGGMVVAAMMNSLAFYVKANEFRGIKIAVFLPILLVGGHYLLKMTDWRKALANPITWGTAALSVSVSLVLVFMIARTGNDSGVGASPVEMVFRNLLDRFLYVRPRTKEFMIGHPLLLVAIGLISSRKPTDPGASRTGWLVLILMLAAIGQTSVVNTLCHLHIPVTLSLARIGLGLGIGCMIGLAVWAIVLRLRPRWGV